MPAFSRQRARKPFYLKSLLFITLRNIYKCSLAGASWVVLVEAKKTTTKTTKGMEVYDIKEIKKRAKETNTWVKKHPWESVGIAALAGAVLGKLFFRRKR